MSRWVRPARPLAPMGVAGAILGAWWLVAHNSGAGWVQALGDVVFGTFFIGIVGPALVVARARIRVVSAPMDSTAGLPVEVRIETSTRLRVRPIHPPGIEGFAGPRGRRQQSEDGLNLLPARRGVHDAVLVDIASAAPFALQWWTRRVLVRLPAALHVAPRCGQPVQLPVRSHEHAGDRTARAPAEVGDPRGARPYRPGDNQRHVHWLATAHTGQLMVREVEGAAAEPIRVLVTLPRDPEEAERLAERALGTVVLLLDRGAPVLLTTTQPSGPVEAAVADRRAAGRRLSQAVPAAGPPPTGPLPAGLLAPGTPGDTTGIAVTP